MNGNDENLLRMRRNGIASFPSLGTLEGNPYWSLLKLSIDQSEFSNIDTAVFTLRWLISHRAEVAILHFHYVQPYYEYEFQYARLIWVIRLMRNLIVAKLLGYKLVFSLHDLTPTYELQPKWVDLLGHWVIIHLADRVLVHCLQARQLLRGRYKRNRDIWVVDHPSFDGIYQNVITKQAAREQLGLKADQVVFTFFGGIRPNKGIENLIRAFTQLQEPALGLIIAGAPFPPPRYISELESLARSDPRILFFFNYIPSEEVQVYLNAADIVVLPFTRILTSGSTMLALTFGKPVIAPIMGCIPELVTDDAGWLYHPRDPEGLVKAMKRAICDDIGSKGSRARAIADQYRHVDMAHDMYQGLVTR